MTLNHLFSTENFLMSLVSRSDTAILPLFAIIHVL